MFSQLKNALESVAQQPTHTASSPEPNVESSSHLSLDMQGARSASLPSSQVAESAMSSLRKSITSQRVGSAPDSPKPPSYPSTTRKSTLEERLRRAAQGSAASDTGSAAFGSSPSSTGGRSDSVGPQPLSRVASSSPATRGRPAEVSRSQPNKPLSRTASPAVTSRPVGSSGLGSKTPSRSSSPAPASKPLSRGSSPVPVSRNPTTTQRTSSPAPTTTRMPSRPPSRAGSPAPAARVRRASELAGKSPRATSPSSLAKHQSPLRRSSTTVNYTPLSNSSIITSASMDSDDSKAALKNSISDEELSVDEKDDEEGEPITAKPAELSVVKSGNSDEDIVSSREEEPHSQTQSSRQSIADLSDEATAIANSGTVLEGNTEPSEPVLPTTRPVHAETADVAEKELSTARQERHPEETDIAMLPDALVTQEQKVPDTDFRSSDSKPNIPSPELDPMILEASQPSTNDQETKLLNAVLDTNHSAEIESLQARLKEVEQRFSDVSTSFKRLQAEKLAADAILKENSPLESFDDPNALRYYFSNLRIKDEVFQEEIKRLTGKLELQDDRLQELRQNHSLETRDLSDELRQTKLHLQETEALFEAAQRATSNVEESVNKQKEENSRLEKDLQHSKNLAKEEEEKRVKAITLLKTVRQKLVKAEKDKEDAMKEMATMKERQKGDKDKEQAEKVTLLRELEVSQSAHAQEIFALRAQFDKDRAATRERHEHEISALKGQQELDLASIKTSHNKEFASRTSQICSLEMSLNNVTRDKNVFFEQLQLRQAELESAQAHADTIQHQNTELEFQLREADDRLALAREEYAELQREVETRSREPSVSAEEIARVVSTTEAKYEARLAEMKRNISVLEKERHESEVDWSRKLKEKVRELEDLRRMLGSATRMRESEENMAANLKTELGVAQETNKNLQREVGELTLLRGQIEELERSLKEQEHETNVKSRVFEKQIDEHKARAAQLKQGNKTLREELRKVQSSAALFERQRNPGIGYWGTRTLAGSGSGDAANGSQTESRVSISSPADTPSRSSSPTPSSTSTKTDEEVNLEYVRNLVLQFLEHKEIRPQLVDVLSTVLHFTPQETRRLIAKV